MSGKKNKTINLEPDNLIANPVDSNITIPDKQLETDLTNFPINLYTRSFGFFLLQMDNTRSNWTNSKYNQLFP